MLDQMDAVIATQMACLATIKAINAFLPAPIRVLMSPRSAELLDSLTEILTDLENEAFQTGRRLHELAQD